MTTKDVWIEMFKRARDVPITNGLYTYTHKLLNIVVIETDDPDVSGIGLAGRVETRPEVGAAIVNHFKKMTRRTGISTVRTAAPAGTRDRQQGTRNRDARPMRARRDTSSE